MNRPRRILLALLVAAAVGAPARAADETKKHPDGSVQSRVPLDKNGQRHGAYQEFYPGGKAVRERSRYDHGKLHGVRTLYGEDKKVLAEETWFEGRLIFPKSPKQIDAARKRLLRDAVEAVKALGKPTNPNAPDREALARALAKLNAYRYLSGLPADVTLSDRYINLCQHGAEVMAKLNQMTHSPGRPPDVTDEFYELAKAGCGQSNIFSSPNIEASVDAYMDDSDAGNVDRIGHRRWVLHPAMAQTGFGASGSFSAMYSFDAARKEVPDFDFVAYPPPGYCPRDMFAAHRAWHVTVNPAHYDVPAEGVKAEIFPLGKKLKRAAQPLPLNYSNIDRAPFGIPNAIIFRPKVLEVTPGATYEVVVTGLKPKTGKPAEISYVVSFY
jgi:hypothetical protein